MGRLSSYILRQIAVGTLFVSVSLMVIVWLLQSLRFLPLMVTEGVSVLAFLHLTTLLLPNLLVTVLPLALYAVIVFAYNRMNNDRELAVIRAAGVGPLAIARPVMIFSWLCAGVILWLAMVGVPDAMHSFRQMQWSMQNNLSRLLLQPGEFTPTVPGVMVYVRSRGGDGQLNDIVVNDERQSDAGGGTSTTFIALQGALVNGPDGPRLVMLNGSRSSTQRGSGALSLLYFDSYSLDIPLTANRDNRAPALDELSWSDLSARLEATAGFNKAQINAARAELHHRLSAPLVAPSLALVAMAIILTGAFNRRSSGWRLLMATVVVFLLEAAVVDSQSLAGRVPALVLLQYAVSVIPAVIAAVVLFRPDGGRSRRRLNGGPTP